jgi:hypothetical protein
MRFDLSDEEWVNLEPSVRRIDDRMILNGIFFVLRAGIPWRDPPERGMVSIRRSTIAPLIGQRLARNVQGRWSSGRATVCARSIAPSSSVAAGANGEAQTGGRHQP